MLGVLASVCEWEHGVLVERTRASIEAARRAGRLPGRRHRLTASERDEVRRLRVEGRSVRDIARMLGLAKSIVGRVSVA